MHVSCTVFSNFTLITLGYCELLMIIHCLKIVTTFHYYKFAICDSLHHPDTAEQLYSVKMINYMHQRKPGKGT